MSHHQQRSKARGAKVPKVEVAKDVTVVSSFRDTIGTIAVVPFGAQRLPELQTLYANSCCRDTNKYDNYHSSDAAITTTSTTIRALQSAGRKLSHIRHLRRRATSYKRYKKKEYYQINKHSNHLNNGSNFNNVVNSTNSINDNNNNQNSPQIHRPRRKVRRQNITQLCHLHETWWRHWESQSRTTIPNTTSNDIAISLLQPSPHNCTTDIHNTTLTTISPSLSKWMTTHLFHRKRCHMTCLWNWYLPLLHINRGCAAALRLVTTIPSTLTHDSTTTTTTTTFGHRSSPPTSKCLIQDTTWSMQPIWFRIVTSNTDDRKKELQQFQTILQSMIPDLHWIELMTTRNDSGTSGCNILSDDSGIMYEPNCFPRKALGPIKWIYRKDGPIFHHHHHVNTTTNNTIPESPDRVHTQSNVTSQDYIYFFVHPSIRSTVFHHLKDILVQHQTPRAGIVTDTGIYGPYSGNALNANTGMNPVHPTGVDMGGAMSCFQLRGSNKSCTDCWNNCFTKLQQGQTSIITPESIDHIYQNTSMNRCTVTASCTEQFFSPLYNFLNQSQNGCDDNHNDITVLHIPLEFLTRQQQQQQQQQAFHSEPQREVNASLSLPSVLLTMCIRRVVPRDASISCNWGVCGYDIYCPPQYSKILFQDFVLHGGACMIGIVEEAYIALESCPPLLVFPRDYPDTPEGQKYWNHSSVEWNFVRHYWEGGGGRISNIQIGTLDHEMKVDVPAVPNHSAKKSLQSTVIDWKTVLGKMDDDNDSNDQIEQNAIVVVRSKDFVQPFQFVLSGCTNFTNEIKISDSDQIVVSESDTKSTTTKKRTRRSPSLANVVAASPISILQRHNHHLMCQSLIDHLSLPAVLMCSVQLLGKGTFHSGATIYSITVSPPRTRNSTGTTPPPLGWVTTGLFSMTRGYCHGIAMIGAKAFIMTIMDGLAVNNDNNGIEERDISPVPYRPPIVIRSCSLSQTKSVQLRVQVENPNCPSIRYDGIVSLLL